MSMNVIRLAIRTAVNRCDRLLGIRALMREDDDSCQHPLAGDRALEWSWVVANLPKKPSCILDLGCVQSVLTGIASRLGHEVTAVDLRDIEYEMPNVNFLKQDILELNFGSANFDLIINCSMIEHVGLKDRYGSDEFTDGDLVAMHKLSRQLAPGGIMILTIPVGLDGEYAPFHRVYGSNRLPRLLEHYTVITEEFWAQEDGKKWKQCTKATALATQGSPVFYALGLFVLKCS